MLYVPHECMLVLFLYCFDFQDLLEILFLRGITADCDHKLVDRKLNCHRKSHNALQFIGNLPN